MSKSTAPNRTRRALLAGAGSVAAAAVWPATHVDAQSAPRLACQSPDRALWVTWYDLPDAGRSEHLAWVHTAYIPSLLKRPGYLWAAHYVSIRSNTDPRNPQTKDPAVPRGTTYTLAIGGEDTSVFGRPTPDELHAALAQEDRKMLAMRTGERTNIFAEAARVAGPAAKEYKDDMTLAPCIQFGTYNLEYRKEFDILAWYAQSSLPRLTDVTGFVRARRLASVAGWAKLGVIYEYASVEHRNKAFGGGGGTSRRFKYAEDLVHAPGSPDVARRIWPSSV